MTLSLCMIVKNEEDNLPRCLDSVKDIVDEMVIVDTGSMDKTIEIARNYGAKVYEFPWNGSFSDARNHGLERATCDWILLMDADEEMDKTSHSPIREIVGDNNNDADAYYGESICYAGDVQGFDTISNLNLRLLRNGKGYYFTQPIHEQLWSNIIASNPSAKVLEANIKVYHYGYLAKDMISHKKSERNIEILKKLYEEDPDNAFTNFNLANEYNVCGDNLQAIVYYEKAYNHINHSHAFSSKLFLRMTSCYMALNRQEDAVRIAKEGLIYYPDFTDLELMMGILHANKGRYTLAIKQFNKCIEMGEASCNLRLIGGAATYKPCHFLADIYSELDDYTESEVWCKKALEFNRDYIPAFRRLIDVYCSMELGQKELTACIENMRYLKYDAFDFIVFEILISNKYYELAINFINKYEKFHSPTAYTCFSRGMCQLYLRKYAQAYKTMQSVKKYPEFFSRCICMQALCKIMVDNYEKAHELLTSENFSAEDGLVTVYLEFVKIVNGTPVSVLSDDERISSIYLVAIMDLLTILLKTHEIVLFEKALGLFNTINENTVLLKLAKLFYDEKCYALAYKEFKHSIKDFDLIDAQGAKMLYKLKYKGF